MWGQQAVQTAALAWVSGRGKHCACKTRSSSASSTRGSPRRRGCSGSGPETCGAVLDALPAVGSARHGIYSGSEVYLVLPALLTPPREHATTIVGPGDVGFLTVEKGSGYGIEEDYSEVCWFYDLDATPSMPEGPIAVNVFWLGSTRRRRRRLLRRLPEHAAGGREEGRDRPRIAGLCSLASHRLNWTEWGKPRSQLVPVTSVIAAPIPNSASALRTALTTTAVVLSPTTQRR